MRNGYILAIVMLLVAIMSLLSIGLILVGSMELRMATNETEYIKAFNYAESGLSYGVAEVKEFALEHPDDTFTEFLQEHQETEELPGLYGEPNVRITLRFEDNYDDGEYGDRPLYDTDCRIRMESVAEFPAGKNPAIVRLRLRVGRMGENDESPCMTHIRFYGWEEVT